MNFVNLYRLTVIAAIGAAPLTALAQSANVSITADFTSPTGTRADPFSYGLNTWEAFDPTVTANQTYEQNVASMAPGMVRYSYAGEMNDSTSDPQGWVTNPGSANYAWDETKIAEALQGSFPYGPARMINIVNWPLYLTVNPTNCSQSGTDCQLDPNKYADYANFAASLVQILNKDLGLNITYFELFNELDNPSNPANYNGNMGEVAKIFIQTAAAMKAVDPKIKVGGPAFSYVSGNPNLSGFFPASGPNQPSLDFVTYHGYPECPPAVPLLQDPGPLYDAAVAIGTQQSSFPSQYSNVPEFYLDAFNMDGCPQSADARMTATQSIIFDALVMIGAVNAGTTGTLAWNEADDTYGKMAGPASTNPPAFSRFPSSYLYQALNSYMRGPVFTTTTSNAEAVVPLAVKTNGAFALALVNRSGTAQTAQLTVNGPSNLGQNATFTVYQVASTGISELADVSYGTLAGGYQLPADTVTILSLDAAVNDFNDDRTSDILWRNANGNLIVWLMNNGQLLPNGNFYFGWAPSDWQVAGVGDFNGDGSADILWHDTNGGVAVWLTQGGQILPNGDVYVGARGTDWQIAGVGDFNGDGSSDILWRNANGNVEVWLMQNGQLLPNGDIYIGWAPTDWQIAGVADFNADGYADILWYDTNGGVAVWLTQNGQILPNGDVYLGTAPAGFQIAGVGDFNGDGYPDILWRDGNGDVGVTLNGGQLLPNSAVFMGSAPLDWQIAGVGDFNGDGYADVLWRNSNGGVAVWLTQGGQILPNGDVYVGVEGTDWTIQNPAPSH